MSRFSISRYAALAAFSVAFSACNGQSGNDPATSPQWSPTDANFIVGATQASNAEIAAANLALTKSANADVRAFAQEMITQHTQEEQALAPIGTAVHYPVPGPTSVNAKQAQMAQTLQTTPEPAFDGVYVNGEIKGHEDNIIPTIIRK